MSWGYCVNEKDRGLALRGVGESNSVLLGKKE